MEYHTPGVYIREVDSGPKPIASVATSIPGFLGLFPFTPPTDAIAISCSPTLRTIGGSVASRSPAATARARSAARSCPSSSTRGVQ